MPFALQIHPRNVMLDHIQISGNFTAFEALDVSVGNLGFVILQK